MSDDLMRIAQDARRAHEQEHGGPMPSVDEMFRGLIDGLKAQQKWWELWPGLRLPPEEVERAREVYAAALGRSVETLTKAEKQTAWMNHVMEELEPISERSE